MPIEAGEENAKENHQIMARNSLQMRPRGDTHHELVCEEDASEVHREVEEAGEEHPSTR